MPGIPKAKGMAKLLGRVCWARSGFGSFQGRLPPVAVMLMTIQEATAAAEIPSKKRNHGSRSG
jgi:hypothetical protein